MARLVMTAVKNPPLFGSVVGGVVGLLAGLILDVVHHRYPLLNYLVVGVVVGAAAGWWQHKRVASSVGKFLLKRLSPL